MLTPLKSIKEKSRRLLLQRRWLVVPLWFTGIQRPAFCAGITAATPGSSTHRFSKARLTEAFAQVVDLPALTSCRALCGSSPAVLFPLIALFDMPISYYAGGVLSIGNVDFFQTVENRQKKKAVAMATAFFERTAEIISVLR